MIGCFALAGCMSKVDRLPNSLLKLSKHDPALSGNGNKLALIVDKKNGSSVELQDLLKGTSLPLRYLSRHQPHSSPSLSWNGRYIAVITQRGNRRLAIIEDQLTGRVHKLPVPGERVPVRLSLSPDASQLAMQLSENGKWRIEVFNLSEIIEPDQPNQRLSGN